MTVRIISPFAPGTPLDTTLEWHLARRVSLAPTTALAEEIAETGYSAWIERQLSAGSVEDTAAQAQLDELWPLHLHDTNTAVTELCTLMGVTDRRLTFPVIHNRARAVPMLMPYVTNRHLYEGLVDFWRDHFNIYSYAAAHQTSWWDYAVTREHALGKFDTILKRAIGHPMMAFYLNNTTNQRTADGRQYNENLGRELLELHTVGEGNYTETDVRNSAYILSGWSQSPTYSLGFSPNRHYVGPVKVMGFADDNSEPADGQTLLARYLTYLAHHPLTARRLARKLCQRYVSDNPPTPLVDRLAATYLAGDTAMVPVLRELFNSTEFKASAGGKLRRGNEILFPLLAAQKARYVSSGPLKDNAGTYELSGVKWMLISLGHSPYRWEPPTGYPTAPQAWSTASMVINRIGVADTVIAGPPTGNAYDLPISAGGGPFAPPAGMPTSSTAAWLIEAATGFTNAPPRLLAAVGTQLTSAGTGTPDAGAIRRAMSVITSSALYQIR